mgnify:CR=1 FL=1
MKSTFLLKTTDGASWAATLAWHLKKEGVKIDAVLPDIKGTYAKNWQDIAENIYLVDLNIRGRQALAFRRKAEELKVSLLESEPDIVHSCFMDTTLVARLALCDVPNIKLVFHVPGPLHLENALTRCIDLRTARKHDYWISSSNRTYDIYRKYGVSPKKLFLAYYGLDTQAVTKYMNTDSSDLEALLERYSIPHDAIKIINANMFYPPKRWLGQRVGVKNHEGLIRAMRLILDKREDAVLVLVGKQWGKGVGYEEYLKEKARKSCGNKIIFTGYLEQDSLFKLYCATDLVVHVPTSENCGGIVEPALLEKPIIAGPVGGLREIIEEGVTGWLTDDIKPRSIAKKVLEVLNLRDLWKSVGARAREKVESLFDIETTAREVIRIYDKLA